MSAAQTHTLPSADGTELFRRRWAGADTSRGAILLVHGLGEHLGRYDHVAAGLNQSGYAVQGVDLHGHGRSGGRRGHVASWGDYRADLDTAAADLPTPFVLFAHSMGGLVALDWLRENTSRVAAVVLSSPLLGVAVDAPRWKVALGKILNKIAPALPLSNELDANDVCSDPEVVRRYLEDPLVFRSITPRWFVEMELALARVHQAANGFTLPLYLNLAGDDRLVSNPDALRLAEQWAGPKTQRIWDGLRHETLNERQGGEVLQGMIDWLVGLDRA